MDDAIELVIGEVWGAWAECKRCLREDRLRLAMGLINPQEFAAKHVRFADFEEPSALIK